MDDLIPRKGFFPAYLRYARQQTDAPDIFHVGTALAMFSAAVAKNATLAIPEGKPMPLHLWVLLVGPSGDRKSTAIQIGERVLIGQESVSPFPVMSVGRSPEATFDLVAQNPRGLLLHPEASTLFDTIRKPAWSDAEGFLCDLYDGQDEYKRLLVGRRTKRNPYPPPIEIVIKSPRLAFLGAVAPDLLRAAARKQACVGGLLGRMLPLWGERTWFKEYSSKPHEVAEGRLRRTFRRLTVGPSRVDFGPEVWEHYKAWCRRLDYERYNYAEDKRAMAVRLTGHVLRVAALYQLSSPNEDEQDVMDRALALGNEAKGSILKLPPMEE